MTYRAIDNYGNTGVCQVQLLAEGTRGRVQIDEKLTSRRTPWQSRPTRRPTTIKPTTLQSSQRLNCKNINAPNNGYVNYNHFLFIRVSN